MSKKWWWAAGGVLLLVAVVGYFAFGVRREVLPYTPPGVEGTWRPVSITGYTIDPARTAANPKEPLIVFRADRTLTTSDGCNVVEIPYEVGEQGAFSFGRSGPQTEIGCWAVPNMSVVLKARRIDVDGDVLTFFDGTGTEVGQYARVRG